MAEPKPSSCYRAEDRDRTWVGLDSGDHTTALCVSDHTGTVISQLELPSKVTAIHSALDAMSGLPPFSITMESCSTSTALAKGLRKLGYHVAVFDCYQSTSSYRRMETSGLHHQWGILRRSGAAHSHAALRDSAIMLATADAETAGENRNP
jgi:hypothetical protein